MTNVVRLVVAIDLDLPLGSQVARARAKGVPWKMIEELTGLTRQRLYQLVLEAYQAPCNKNAKKIASLQIRQRHGRAGPLSVTRRLIAGGGSRTV